MSAEERLVLIRFDNVTSCIRRAAWEQIPFPERSFGEDMAWAKRVLLGGSQIAYVPTAQVWHLHERTWMYEFRRAYVAGNTRRDLVNWPSPQWSFSEVAAALRRMVFFLRTDRYDSLQEREEIQRFLLAEKYHYEPLKESLPTRTYVSILDYAMSLSKSALRLCPAGVFPEKAWMDLFRFANVAILGEVLGSASLAGRTELAANDRLAWILLHTVLSKGV
jgi:hypothetical protein